MKTKKTQCTYTLFSPSSRSCHGCCDGRYRLFDSLNTPMVLAKVSTGKKAALLPIRPVPRSEGHGTLPTGAAPLLLERASHSRGSGSRLGGGRASGVSTAQTEVSGTLKKHKGVDPHLKSQIRQRLSCPRSTQGAM